MQQLQGGGVALVFGQQLDDHPILIVRRVDRRDLARAIGVIERLLDLLTETPRLVARSRSMRTLTCGFLICRSVVTSCSVGMPRRARSSFAALSYRASMSALCSVNWYWVLVGRPPMRMEAGTCR